MHAAPQLAARDPRCEPDLLLVMSLQAMYAREAPPGSDRRADAQQAWRKAYFDAKRKGLILDE